MKASIVFTIFIFISFMSSQSFACKPVMAVYPTWKHNDNTLATLPWNRFTHLVVFAAHPSDKGDLLTDRVDQFITSLVSKAHNNNKKVIISIGGAGEASKAFIKISSSPDLREQFAKNIARYVKKYNVDGVDIDWEYWTRQNEQRIAGNDPIESKNLVKLLSTVRKTLPENIILTTDIFAGPWLGPQYLPEIQRHVEFVNLMAFDFTGQWDSSAIAHHSDFNTFKLAINYSLGRGFDKNKLLIGLPAYGKEFSNGKNKKVTDIPYHKIVEELKFNRSSISKGQFGNIHFETIDNIEKKIKYIKDNSFPGISFFEITADHLQSDFSLLRSASRSLNPPSCYQ